MFNNNRAIDQHLNVLAEFATTILEDFIENIPDHEYLENISADEYLTNEQSRNLNSLKRLKALRKLNNLDTSNNTQLQHQKVFTIAERLVEIFPFSRESDLLSRLLDDIKQPSKEPQNLEQNFDSTLEALISYYGEAVSEEDTSLYDFEMQTLVHMVSTQNTYLQHLCSIVETEEFKIANTYTLQSEAIEKCIDCIKQHKILDADLSLQCVKSIQDTFELLWAAPNDLMRNSRDRDIKILDKKDTHNSEVELWCRNSIEFMQEQNALLLQIQATIIQRQKLAMNEMQQALSQQSKTVEALQKQLQEQDFTSSAARHISNAQMHSTSFFIKRS